MIIQIQKAAVWTIFDAVQRNYISLSFHPWYKLITSQGRGRNWHRIHYACVTYAFFFPDGKGVVVGCNFKSFTLSLLFLSQSNWGSWSMCNPRRRRRQASSDIPSKSVFIPCSALSNRLICSQLTPPGPSRDIDPHLPQANEGNPGVAQE